MLVHLFAWTICIFHIALSFVQPGHLWWCLLCTDDVCKWPAVGHWLLYCFFCWILYRISVGFSGVITLTWAVIPGLSDYQISISNYIQISFLSCCASAASLIEAFAVFCKTCGQLFTTSSFPLRNLYSFPHKIHCLQGNKIDVCLVDVSVLLLLKTVLSVSPTALLVLFCRYLTFVNNW